MGSTAYLTFKTLHLIGIISWMAGLLYLFRIFVYHHDRGKTAEIRDLLSLMAKRLYRFITFPAMMVAVVAGALMIAMNPVLLSQPWFHMKLTCGLIMVGFTFYGGVLQQRFQAQETQGLTSKRLRIMNEGPTLLMIVIVALVVFRPLMK